MKTIYMLASYSKIKVTKDAGQSWTYIKPGLANIILLMLLYQIANPDRAWVTFSEYNSYT